MAARFKFVSRGPVPPELLRANPLEAVHALAPWDAVQETILSEKIKIVPNDEWPDSVYVIHIGTAERKPPRIEYPDTEGGRWARLEAEEEEELLRGVTVACPECGAEQEDLDGFGVLFCPACGFCTHVSVSGFICGLCGKKVE